MEIRIFSNGNKLKDNGFKVFDDFDEAFCTLNYYAQESPEILNTEIVFSVQDNNLTPLSSAELQLKVTVNK